MSTQRKQYSAEFKARVAFEALKGLKTINELASAYGVHPTQIAHWKHRLQQEMPDIFSARRAKREHDHEAFQAQLYQQIGQLKVELDWVKKTRVAKSAGVSSSPASRDMRLDHGESADAGFVADGESPVPAAALARP